MLVNANYQLINDNLLDLSHVQFLHPLLRIPDGATHRHKLQQEGDTVWSMLWRDNSRPNALHQMLSWPANLVGDSRAHMRWDAPGIMFLDVGIAERGAPPETGVAVPSVHLLTPETDETTHYFWGFLRNRELGNQEVDEKIRTVALKTFELEDKPIIEAQQMNIRTNEVMSLRPALLQPDASAVRARKVLKKLIDDEGVQTISVAISAE